MKVAIVGAGLSGLSCAIELERRGIEPVILEKRSQVGDRFINAEVFVSMFSRPIMDEIRYLAEEHDLLLRPTSNVRELVLHSATKHAILQGPIGFVSIRGRHQEALEHQLAKQVQTKIHFHCDEPYEEIAREYDYVVMATGDAAYTEKIQRFDTGLTVTLNGATVEGHFSRTRIICWFNNDFAPHGGTGYLIPFSEREASLVIGFPEYERVETYDKTALWQMFYDRTCRDLQQHLKVTDTFEVNQYRIGLAESPRIGNTFFVGNCSGAIMPLMGFGQFPSILSGIYAARDICKDGKFEQWMAPIRKSYVRSLDMRRWLELLDNDEVDHIIERLNGYIGHKLVHSRVNALKWASYIAKARLPFDHRSNE